MKLLQLQEALIFIKQMPEYCNWRWVPITRLLMFLQTENGFIVLPITERMNFILAETLPIHPGTITIKLSIQVLLLMEILPGTNFQWDALYTGIGDANLLIQNATNSTSTADAIKNTALGEGLFMRAYNYLRLVASMVMCR